MFIPNSPVLFGESDAEEEVDEGRKREDQEMETARQNQVRKILLKLQLSLHVLCSLLNTEDALLKKCCTTLCMRESRSNACAILGV